MIALSLNYLYTNLELHMTNMARYMAISICTMLMVKMVTKMCLL